MSEEDLYRVLGVPRDATADEIKKAYRKLARRHHPDFNPGDKQAEERFKKIAEAHDILGDPEKRKIYDEFGLQGLRAGFDPARARAARQSARQWRNRAEPFPGGGFGRYSSFEDIVGDLFGRESGGARGAGADAEASLEVDLMDAIRGASREIEIDHAVPCATCQGLGVDKASEVVCPECQGRGHLRVGQGPIALQRSCPRCAGKGRTATRPCAACSGRGHVSRHDRLRVHVPAGVDTGSRVRVQGHGGPGRGGGPPGDLYLTIRVRPHPVLRRRESDLLLDVPITVGEATRGATIMVPTPEGEVRLKVPPGSQSGKRLRLRGRGVPRLKGKGRGDLYVRLMVQVPVRDDDEVRAAVKTIESAYGGDVRSGLRL